ncbi:1-phosphatidylinositol-4,5-bisphosphate phosphodiesterase 1 [Mycena alexandri]|uniref:Phosphoinositide phospholipase C n=1 Tax=Mycena alexandri TaxID=1745969 RepID=A0AAD6SGB9_9AGAR|nr:1-phosphatidylinositol-4,5-bisphosphate phosphodiesterase 1 [Mycena alexandri]
MATTTKPTDIDTTVPLLLQQGTRLIKISEKSQKKVVFRIDPDEGQILYDSRKNGCVPIECIKEIRTGPAAEYYCTQFRFSGDAVDRWITIVYVLNSTYKTLHLLAPTRDMFLMWHRTVEKLYTIRLGLIDGNLDHNEVRETIWEKQYWKGADTGKDQSLNLDEVKSMCVRLNIDFPKEEVERLFKEADTTQKKSLTFAEFQHFVKMLKARPELEALYKRLGGGNVLAFQIFEKFMKETQKSTDTSAELKVLFEKYATVEIKAPVVLPATASGPTATAPAPVPLAAPTSTTSATTTTAPVLPPAPSTTPATNTAPPPASTPVPAVVAATSPDAGTYTEVTATSPPVYNMSLENFSSFLISQDNGPTYPESNDMTQPMSDYFISTSHNTYLVGNQLMGVSTIEGYIRALLCACRSVEMDIYDGPREPMVYHGKTLTSAVSVREICQAIAKYAFVSSPYPVTLSCEIHCGLVQQDMLVDIMTNAFGSALVRVPVTDQLKLVALPSPEALKGRIMVKTKNLFVAAELDAIKAHKKVAEAAAAKAAHLEAEPPSSESSESESEAAFVVQEIGQEIGALKHKWHKLRGIPSPPTSGPGDSKTKAKAKVPMSMALASLLVYTVGVKCRGIDPSEDYAVEQIFSLSENSANKYIKGGVGIENLIRHTQTHVVRIYPKGTRINSTNYEPLQYWAAGCQLVALNIQTMDLGYRINQAMFMRRGRQGYVLKPPALRDPHFEELRKHTRHFFDVTIISAQQLPRPKDSSGKEIIGKSFVDPLVEVALHIPTWSESPFLPKNKGYAHIPPTDASSGSGTSARTITFSTGAVKNNGFNPMWQEELCLPFDCVGGMKDLIFVEFIVKQDKKRDAEPLASYIAPLSSLKHGFRHLPLHDVQLSQYLFSTLFVYINIRDV